MDERSLSPLIGLPGREKIGLVRHWHGFSVMLWVLNGLVYVILLFATGLWRRLIPTSWDIFPEAWESAKIYMGLGIPSIEHFRPYDALQRLAYTGVIFGLAPFMILTGLAISPAIRVRFPWYVNAFGGHQGARSLHFIAMVCMTAFIVMHVGHVFLVHREHNLVHMALGSNDTALYAQALTMVLGTIVAVVLFWIGLSYFTLANRPLVHGFLVTFTEVGRKLTLNNFRPQGPKQLPQQSYVATHTCMQGWSATSR